MAGLISDISVFDPKDNSTHISSRVLTLIPFYLTLLITIDHSSLIWKYFHNNGRIQVKNDPSFVWRGEPSHFQLYNPVSFNIVSRRSFDIFWISQWWSNENVHFHPQQWDFWFQYCFKMANICFCLDPAVTSHYLGKKLNFLWQVTYSFLILNPPNNAKIHNETSLMSQRMLCTDSIHLSMKCDRHPDLSWRKTSGMVMDGKTAGMVFSGWCYVLVLLQDQNIVCEKMSIKGV